MPNLFKALYVFPDVFVAMAGLVFVAIQYQRHPEDRRRTDLLLVVCLFGPVMAALVTSVVSNK
jgi:hypothetical protein